MMPSRSLHLIAALLFTALVATIFDPCSGNATDGFVATVTTSAIVPTQAQMPNTWIGSALIEITVLGFRPPEDGAVRAVVSLEARGEIKPIGRFSLFPNEEFKATSDADIQRYIFRLPAGELAKYADAPVNIRVDLVPIRGVGQGARLEIGDAKIMLLR